MRTMVQAYWQIAQALNGKEKLYIQDILQCVAFVQ